MKQRMSMRSKLMWHLADALLALLASR